MAHVKTITQGTKRVDITTFNKNYYLTVFTYQFNKWMVTGTTTEVITYKNRAIQAAKHLISH
nr:hypothetical protein [uncultured Flavobacterium sp.]